MDRLLIIAAHPDDDILGCGSLIAKYCSKKNLGFSFLPKGPLVDIEDKIRENRQRRRKTYRFWQTGTPFFGGN